MKNGDQRAFKKQILEADWKTSLKEAAKHQSYNNEQDRFLANIDRICEHVDVC